MRVILLGAANPHTEKLLAAVQRAQPGFQVAGFLDNDPQKKGQSFLGHPILGGFEALESLDLREHLFVNLITGSTRARYETSRALAQRGCRFTNLIHPSVDLGFVALGVGNYIQEGVLLQHSVRIGDNASIHMGALVGHETQIGNSVFVAHGVSLSGSVEIGDGTFVGTHATVLPRVKIGRWCTIGAGAVVLKDVPDCTTVVGNPGRAIRTDLQLHASGDIFEGVTR